MRENRLAKLAGLKKIAEDGSYDDSYKSKSISELYEVLSRELMSLINVDEDAVKAAGYYLGKSKGTEEGAIEYFRINHPSHAGGSRSLKEAMDNKRSDMYDNFKQGFTEGKAKATAVAVSLEARTVNLFTETITYLNKYMNTMDKDSAVRYANRQFDYNAFSNSLDEKDKAELTNRHKSIWDDYLSGVIKHIDKHYGKRNQGRGGSPQATTGSSAGATIVELTSPPKTVLTETGTDGRAYVYTILSTLSFSYTVDNSPSKTVTTSYSSWNTAAEKLNALEAIRKNQAAPVAAATPAATAETPAATTAQEASFDPTLVSNVSILLRNASNRAYALFVPGNQQQQLTTMFRAIDSAARRSGIEGVINPSQFLAKIIIARLGPESLAGIGRITNISSLRQGQIKRQAGQEVASLMSEVNKTYESYGGDDFRRMLVSFSSKMKKVEASPTTTPATAAPATAPAATTTTPATTTTTTTATAPAAAADADDGQNKSASLNKKFIKAATLRRLKIRSQMEAAIDSSAQMGRARVS